MSNQDLTTRHIYAYLMGMTFDQFLSWASGHKLELASDYPQLRDRAFPAILAPACEVALFTPPFSQPLRRVLHLSSVALDPAGEDTLLGADIAAALGLRAFKLATVRLEIDLREVPKLATWYNLAHALHAEARRDLEEAQKRYEIAQRDPALLVRQWVEAKRTTRMPICSSFLVTHYLVTRERTSLFANYEPGIKLLESLHRQFMDLAARHDPTTILKGLEYGRTEALSVYDIINGWIKTDAS